MFTAQVEGLGLIRSRVSGIGLRFCGSGKAPVNHEVAGGVPEYYSGVGSASRQKRLEVARIPSADKPEGSFIKSSRFSSCAMPAL